jgi:hypothetical protein
MTKAANKWQFVAMVWLACNTLCACGGSDAEGARYTIDGQVKFASTELPPSGTTLKLESWWKAAPSLDHEPPGAADGEQGGGGGTPKSEAPLVSVGRWTPTADPHVYAFSVVVEADRPANGDEPMGAGVTLTLPEGGQALGEVWAHEVADEEDGWIPVHLVVKATLSPWQ